MPVTATDRAWMARALNRARLGEIGTYPNPRVGCVIVRDDQVLAEGPVSYTHLTLPTIYSV